MARRNASEQPPSLEADFSATEPVSHEAISELQDKITTAIRKYGRENWRALFRAIVRVARKGAAKHGGLS